MPDIEAAIASIEARGVQLIDEQPRAGAHGSRIAFIHPSSAGGLLIELKQLGLQARDVWSRRCTFGEFDLRSLVDGFFRLDGGAMFGVVPKPLWERRAPADERNRIPLACVRCSCGRRRERAHRRRHRRQDESKEAEIYGIDRRHGLDASLAEAG